MQAHGSRSRGSPRRQSIDTALDAFDAHLRDVCGLSQATRIQRRRYAGSFLRLVFCRGVVDATRLKPRHVAMAVPRIAPGLAPRSLGVVTDAVRSWLRFQRLLGACDARLAAAVPATRFPRLATLPCGLSDDDVDRLLAAFDRRSPGGLRDHAICLCMLDLGLRSADVAGLKLDDVDWEKGVLRIRVTKSRRAETLPVPARVGRALAEYLRRGRPASVSRDLFVRHRRPEGGDGGVEVARSAIRNAARRAGIESRCTGPHSLRRTAATRLLRAGASLKEVADVLRHRSLDTTAIYAKVDRKMLDRVALPWPGSAS